MSTSSERAGQPSAVVRGDAVGNLTRLPTPELRTGQWTRLGDAALLGDPVAETALAVVAENTRAAARAQGYAVGWAQGRRDAEAAAAAAARESDLVLAERERVRSEEHLQALAALDSAAAQLREVLADLCARVEEQATELAWALTEELVGRELSVASGPDAVRRVLALAPSSPVTRVRLHPDALADPSVAELTDRGMEVVPDPTLGRADAMVESDGSVLDLRVDTALQRVREVLR